MIEFPALHAELTETNWVRNHRPDRACIDIYQFAESSEILRISSLDSFVPDEIGKEQVRSGVDVLATAAKEFDRLRKAGVHVIEFSHLITAGSDGTRYLLTRAERVRPGLATQEDRGIDLLFAGLSNYVYSAHEARSPILRDIFKIGQYMYGYTETDNANRYRLMDLDPLVDDPREPATFPDYDVARRSDIYTDHAMGKLLHMIAPGGVVLGEKLKVLPQAKRAIEDYYFRRLWYAPAGLGRMYENQLDKLKA